MKRRTLFAELLSVLLVIVLLIVSAMAVLFYINMRDTRIESRIEALKAQARDVANLAGEIQDTSYLFFNVRSGSNEYLYWKTNEIYRNYNAYTVIVERSGRAYSFYSESAMQDKSMAQLPDTEEMKEYLRRATSGEEIAAQTGSASSPLFTVIVPWTKENSQTGEKTVMGIVLIQTAAQNIKATYQNIWLPTLLIAVAVFLIAGVLMYLITRRITRPLGAISYAASEMMKGDFSARAPAEGTAEVLELSRTFNSMAQQLESVEQSRRDFVANVSHELRSPITSIQGFAEGMLDGTISPNDNQQYLEVITGEARRLNKLITKLLHMSRIENESIPLSLSSFDINELFRRVLLQRTVPLEDKKAEVRVSFEKDPCYVYADMDQIEQVLINLIDNAIKFLPEAGELTLSTRVERETVFCVVQDNGPGISAEDAPHIFERFYKGDKAHTAGSGTGLGLAICKMILDKHGQQITLKQANPGAVFEFTLQKAKGKKETENAENKRTGED